MADILYQGKWSTWNYKLPSDLTGASDSLSDLINLLLEYLKIAKTAIETASAFLTEPLDAASATINSLIDELNRLVEGLLDDQGIYILPVPITKRLMTNFYNFGDITPDFIDDLGVFTQNYSYPRPGEPGYDPMYDPEKNPQLRRLLTDVNRYAGGNAGFFRTYLQSIHDLGDVNRPQFMDEKDCIAGATFVMGSAIDPLGFLDDLWRLMNLFRLGSPLPKIPRPENLKGRALKGAPYGGTTFSTFLEWDPLSPVIYHLEDLGNVILVPERMAIVRSTDVSTISAKSITDMIGTRILTNGLSQGNATVIYEDEFDLTKTTHIDEDITLEHEHQSFYYCIAYKLKGYGNTEALAANAGTSFGYSEISNIVRIWPHPILPASTPPDWTRTPSVAELIPELAYFIRMLLGRINQLAKRATSTMDIFSNHIKFLESELLRYERMIRTLLYEILKLKTKLDLPLGGLYYKLWSVKGGNNGMTAEIARSLTHTQDPNRPPFDSGDEYTAGLVCISGGPTEASVYPFITMFELLFGGTSSSDIETVIEDLKLTSGDLTEPTFGDNLAAGGTPTTTEPEVRFGNDLEPSTVNPRCAPDLTVTKTFGTDMEPT